MQAIHDFGDLTPLEFPFQVGGKKFILREVSADVAQQYRGRSLLNVEMSTDDDGGRTVKKLGSTVEVELFVLSKSIYECEDDTNPTIKLTVTGDADPTKLLPVTTLKRWPDRITRFLFDKLKELSPSLTEREDAESLKKQRAKLDAKIKKLEEAATLPNS